MKILIIGDNPSVTGGVCNYTRPLFEMLSRDNDIVYLYSSSRVNPEYDFSFKTRIIKEEKNVFKIINSVNLTKNYHNLDIDIASERNDNVFEEFIKKNKFDVMHVHEIIGFSSNIINIAKKFKIKTYVTVHEYWWLCPHRVMVDFDRKICKGPADMRKCSYCVHSQRKLQPKGGYTKFRFALKNQFPNIFNSISSFKGLINQYKSEDSIKASKEGLSFDNIKYDSFHDKELEGAVERRLQANIEALNLCDTVIGVSQSVKDILIEYGVRADKIIVQHIGISIANQKISHTKKIDSANIVFGFIGGVGYYKGVHQFIEAYINMPTNYKEKSQVDVYGVYTDGYIRAITEDILGLDSFTKKVKFHGRYDHNKIAEICNTIDISVLPSLCADTAPQTIFESFNADLPIIAPIVGGFPDFVVNDVNGLLYKSSSVDDLMMQMMKIIDNPSLIAKFSKNIPNTKTLDENVQELIKLYSIDLIC